MTQAEIDQALVDAFDRGYAEGVADTLIHTDRELRDDIRQRKVAARVADEMRKEVIAHVKRTLTKQRAGKPVSPAERYQAALQEAV